ncbi:CLUMA_CG005892, isoform A [Clunio marinus]|uniref:CLUMA_CG005892, isoform A n=1 Tax=Clunio marinus TaxID=568069 RepID=A0A1J1I0G8_9DIPT|nr:CLUMA_CG005892, isoform A [Clunio marinus]
MFLASIVTIESFSRVYLTLNSGNYLKTQQVDILGKKIDKNQKTEENLIGVIIFFLLARYVYKIKVGDSNHKFSLLYFCDCRLTIKNKSHRIKQEKETTKAKTEKKSLLRLKLNSNRKKAKNIPNNVNKT